MRAAKVPVRKSRIKMDTASRIYTVFIYVFVTFVTLLIAYPMYFCVIACSFFINYRIVFRKASAKHAEPKKVKGGTQK